MLNGIESDNAYDWERHEYFRFHPACQLSARVRISLSTGKIALEREME